MANSTVLFIQQTVISGRNTLWRGTAQRNRGSWGSSYFSSLPDKSSLSVSRRVTKHQSWHPHSSSSLYTTAQAGSGPQEPKVKEHQLSSTLLVKPLTAETRPVIEKQPNHHRLIQPVWKIIKRKEKICSSFSRVLAESITHKSPNRKSAHLT